jgi:hypothetical protein
MIDYVCIRRYEQSIDADMVAGLLEYRGIRAVVRFGEDRVPAEAESAGESLYEVLVPRSRSADAEIILRTILSDPP